MAHRCTNDAGAARERLPLLASCELHAFHFIPITNVVGVSSRQFCPDRLKRLDLINRLSRLATPIPIGAAIKLPPLLPEALRAGALGALVRPAADLRQVRVTRAVSEKPAPNEARGGAYEVLAS